MEPSRNNLTLEGMGGARQRSSVRSVVGMFIVEEFCFLSVTLLNWCTDGNS